ADDGHPAVLVLRLLPALRRLRAEHAFAHARLQARRRRVGAVRLGSVASGIECRQLGLQQTAPVATRAPRRNPSSPSQAELPVAGRALDDSAVVEPPVRLELTTFALQERCSTN